jgi:hypothetical protein
MLVILLVALAMAIGVRILIRRQRQAAPSGDAVAAASPTFRVVALGVSGSGKTVFLASMFHRLHVRSPGGSYFLETDAAQRVALGQVFGKIADARAPWPPGTDVGQTREFTFDCMAFNEGTKHKIMTINYLDFAGELLESQQEAGGTALTDLEQRIKGAHALLGMIDGHRVLQMLRQEPAGHAYFHSTIQPMIGFMASATCPIHFVLTKWDLVRGFGEPPDASDDVRLRLVRDALMDAMQLDALVSRQGVVRRIVRLIPVSAVGVDYARIDEHGQVVKRPEGVPRPTNLEAPLSAVLPDLFRQVEASLDASVRAEIDARVRSHMRLSPRDTVALAARLLGAPAGLILRTGLQLGTSRAYGDEVVTMFLDWMGSPFADKTGVVEQSRREAEQHTELIRELRDEMFKEFETTVLRLEVDLSASRLSGW